MNIKFILLQLVHEEIFEAQVRCELGPIELSVANLALNHHGWAFSLNVLTELCPCHVLIVFLVTNITSKFGALVQCMLLQLTHRFPYDRTLLFITHIASVGEFAKVNAVFKHFVYFLHEILIYWVALDLAVRAQSVIRAVHLGLVLQLKLAVLAKQLIALSALERLVREVAAHHALDLIHHLSLQFVLDLGHFYIKLGNGLGAHNLLDGLVRYDQFHVPLVRIGLDVAAQPLMGGVFHPV